MSYEQFREQCAKVLDDMAKDARSVAGPISLVNYLFKKANEIRALPLPECPSAYREVTCTAGKEHQCCACGGFIQRGKIYLYQSGVWSGEPRDFITCTDCVALRKQVIDDRSEQLRAVLDALSKRCYIMSESHQVNGVLGARLIVGFNNVVDAGDAHSAISALNGGAA